MCPPSPDIMFHDDLHLSVTGEAYRTIMNMDRSELRTAQARALEAAAQVYKQVIVPLRHNTNKVRDRLLELAGPFAYEGLMVIPSCDLEITADIMHDMAGFESHSIVVETFLTNLITSAELLNIDVRTLQFCFQQYLWLLNQYRQGRIAGGARRQGCSA